jgi:hypothetical protein
MLGIFILTLMLMSMIFIPNEYYKGKKTS